MLPSDSSALLRRNRELSILNHIAETLNRTSDIQVALDETLASLVDLLGLQTGWIFLLDDAGKLYIAAYHALPPAMEYPGRSWIGGCDCNRSEEHTSELHHPSISYAVFCLKKKKTKKKNNTTINHKIDTYM